MSVVRFHLWPPKTLVNPTIPTVVLHALRAWVTREPWSITLTGEISEINGVDVGELDKIVLLPVYKGESE